MKKIIFLAAVAVAVAACSKTYEVEPVSEQAIGFGTWAETLTKAPHTSGTDFSENDIFYVYGYKDPTAKTPVFDGVSVTKGSSAWTYSPTRFWDHDASSYTFYAVSPSENNVAVSSLIDATNSSILTDGKMKSVDLTFSGNNNDVLIAEEKTVVEADYGKTVNLNFHHAASLVDLKVRKGAGLENATVKVKAVSFVNIKSKGSFSITSYNATSHVPVMNATTWTAEGTTAEYNNTNCFTPVNISTDGLEITAVKTASSSSDPQLLINNLVAMPQTFVATNTTSTPTVAGQALQITYTITTGSGTSAQTNTFTGKTYDLVLFDKTDYNPSTPDSTSPVDHNGGTKITGWLPGVHYTYIITIDAQAIVFSATMTEWETDGGYYYLVN